MAVTKIGCDNSKNLGCFEHCGVITFENIIATQTGDYNFTFVNRGEKIKQTANFTAGDKINVTNIFNEDSEICMTIKQPDNTAFIQDDKDTFYFKTEIIYRP